jgi:hypothetical protein
MRFNLQGAEVAVSGDATVLDALRGRFGGFPSAGGAAELTYRFDRLPSGAEHQIACPAGPARPVYDPPVGQVLYVEVEDCIYIECGDRVRSICQPAEGRVGVSVVGASVDDAWLLSHPLFTLPLVEMLKRRGRYSIHAACLDVNGRALLLPGTSGSGKSTLSIALARAGFGFLGDDMTFLENVGGGVRVLGFPDEIDATDETLRFFSELRHLAEQAPLPGWPKRRLDPAATFGRAPVPVSRPGAIVFPRVASAERSVLRPISRAEALLELVPNVLLTDPTCAQAHLDALGYLIRDSLCYRLETGRDLDALPGMLCELHV